MLTLFFLEDACVSTSLYLTNLFPLPRAKKNLIFLNSPVVPAGVISRKCLTKSSRFSDLALKTRQRIILFVLGSGLVKDAGTNFRASWNWITISLTSLSELSGMDWMEVLIFSGSARPFSVFPWKWFRTNWNNEIKCNKRELSRRNVFYWRPNILSWLKVCSRRKNSMQIAPKIIRERILLAPSLSTTMLLWYNDMKNSDLYLLWKICLSHRRSLHDLLCEWLAAAKKQIKSTFKSF